MKKVLTVLLCFGLVSIGFGQSDPLNITGNGARAAGMGNAFTGVADDATAISWNPAGLTQLKAPEASVVTRLGFGSVDASLPSIFAGTGSSMDVKTEIPFSLNFISIVYPLKFGDKPLVIGFAYRRIFDFAGKLTTTLKDPTGSIEFVSDKKGGVDGMSPSIGLQLTNQLAIGATFNIFTGSIDGTSSQTTTPPDPVNDYSQNFKLEYSGSSIDLGLLAKLSKEFSIGFSSTLPFKLTKKESGVDDTEYKFPFMFSFGIAYRVTDNLLMAFDYRSRPISQLETTQSGQTYKGDYFGYKDVNSIHVGAEYLLIMGETIIPIRAGFSTEPATFEDAKGDQVKGTVISFGSGLIFTNITFDASFELYSADYPYVDVNPPNGEYINFKEKFSKISIAGIIHLQK